MPKVLYGLLFAIYFLELSQITKLTVLVLVLSPPYSAPLEGIMVMAMMLPFSVGGGGPALAKCHIFMIFMLIHSHRHVAVASPNPSSIPSPSPFSAGPFSRTLAFRQMLFNPFNEN